MGGTPSGSLNMKRFRTTSLPSCGLVFFASYSFNSLLTWWCCDGRKQRRRERRGSEQECRGESCKAAHPMRWQ